ncbi:MAG: hypothetical protein HYW01_06430 [Deltaproteobacteria bacterium]|nr:hypothetical protein [Deltaproteobacteria bacterium]
MKDRLLKLTDAYIDGILEKETYLDKKNTLILEEKDVKENLVKLDRTEHKVIERIEKYLELANNAYLSYKMGNPSQKRELVKITTSNLTVEGKKVIIELDYSFTLAEKRPENSNGDPYRDVPRTLETLFSKLFEYFSKESPDMYSERTRLFEKTF